MANSTNLVLTFENISGQELVAVYPYIKTEVTATMVRDLMEGIIINGSIFAQSPAAMKSAKIVSTEETPIDI